MTLPHRHRGLRFCYRPLLRSPRAHTPHRKANRFYLHSLVQGLVEECRGGEVARGRGRRRGRRFEGGAISERAGGVRGRPWDYILFINVEWRITGKVSYIASVIEL